MRYLADTHLLIWAMTQPAKLSEAAASMLGSHENDLFFSLVSIWETAIKFGLGRSDFLLPPAALRGGLLDAGFHELGLTHEHAIAVSSLPLLHRDPFDRMLVAQANVEGIILLTSDATLGTYAGALKV